jgi:hypothetical protein
MLTAAFFGKLAFAEAIEWALWQLDEELLELQMPSVPWESGWLKLIKFLNSNFLRNFFLLFCKINILL